MDIERSGRDRTHRLVERPLNAAGQGATRNLQTLDPVDIFTGDAHAVISKNGAFRGILAGFAQRLVT